MFCLILICLRRISSRGLTRTCMSWKNMRSVCLRSWSSPSDKDEYAYIKERRWVQRMLAPYKYKVYITSVTWVIPQWFSCVSHPLGSRPWECLSRIPWWCPCDCMRWAVGLLAADKGRLDIWKPWPLAHKATRKKNTNLHLKKLTEL